MLAVSGIYDGKNIRITDTSFKEDKKFRVIITFLDELKTNEEKEIRNYAALPDSFEFWNEPAEDIYQDYLTKKPTE